MLFSKGITEIAVALDNLLDYHGETMTKHRPEKRIPRANKYETSCFQDQFHPKLWDAEHKGPGQQTNKKQKTHTPKMQNDWQACPVSLDDVTSSIHCLMSDEQHGMIQLMYIYI